MLEKLAAADPNDGRALRAVGWGYYQLGNTLFAGSDLAGALESRRKAFAIREQFAARDPQNAQARFDLAVAHTDLAESLTSLGQPQPAVGQAQQGLKIFQELAAADPSNAIYSRNVALCEEKLADSYARSGADAVASEAQRLQAWQKARDWYDKSGELFLDLRTHGTLTSIDADKPKELATERAICEQALAQLRSVLPSP
jgi:tetratricopeptide (TPR) repeat protein